MPNHKELDQFKQFKLIINQLKEQVYQLPNELDGFQRHILAKLKEIQKARTEDLPYLAKTFVKDIQQLDAHLAQLAADQQKTISGLTEQLKLESLALKQHNSSPSLSNFSVSDFYPVRKTSMFIQIISWVKLRLMYLSKISKLKKVSAKPSTSSSVKRFSQSVLLNKASSKSQLLSKKTAVVHQDIKQKENIQVQSNLYHSNHNTDYIDSELKPNNHSTIKSSSESKKKRQVKKKPLPKLKKYSDKLKSTQAKSFTKQIDVDDPSMFNSQLRNKT